MSELHVGLQWVLVDGELHHVSSFANLPRRKRPLVYCPVCERRLVLKLGSVRAHHAAHQPQDVCAATQPETILHLNTKLHIYNQLKSAHQKALVVVEPCTSLHNDYNTASYVRLKPQQRWLNGTPRNSDCQRTRDFIWLSDWDRVEIEYTVTSLRPDIAILKEGRVIGAIEVFVTHSVSAEKARVLAELCIPWLEVIGQEELFVGDSAWRIETPFPFYRMQPQAWTCPSCTDFEQREKEAAEYRRNNYTAAYCGRIVDFYFPSGKKHREVYIVMEEVKGGQRVRMWLQDRNNNTLVKCAAPITDASMKAMKNFVTETLERRQRGAIWDSPMKWDRHELPRIWEYDDLYSDFYFQRRYVWSNRQKKWFMPKDKRELTWNNSEESEVP